MKKVISFVAIAFFTISISAQEGKTLVKEKAKKESCCAKKDSKSKSMTAAEVAKCKAEGKKCDSGSGKKC